MAASTPSTETVPISYCQCCPQCTILLSCLPAQMHAAIAAWLQGLPRLQYAPGERLIREGLPASGLYLICNGHAKVVQSREKSRSTSPAGKAKELIFKFVGPAEMVGEECLLGDGVYSYYVEALAPLEARFIDRPQLEVLLKRVPELSLLLTKKLALEVKAFQDRLIESSLYSCRKRIARVLLALTDAYGSKDHPPKLHLKRADLAKTVGVSVETAIRTLSAFEARGWVQIDYHTIALKDRKKLAELATPLHVDSLEHVF